MAIEIADEALRVYIRSCNRHGCHASNVQSLVRTLAFRRQRRRTLVHVVLMMYKEPDIIKADTSIDDLIMIENGMGNI